MEKELVKKVVKITNFTVTEIQKLIDMYKETTQVSNSTKLSDNHGKLEQEWVDRTNMLGQLSIERSNLAQT